MRIKASKRRRWALAVAAVAIFAMIALFVKAYKNTGTPPGPSLAGGGGSSVSQPAPSPTPGGASSSAGASPATAGSGLAAVISGGTLPQRTITPEIPGGFTFAPVPSYTLVLTVNSSGPIGRLGYVIPTSQNDGYGDIRNVGTHWSLITTVYGKPYYAALFIAAGAGGAAVTCSIAVDGVVKDTKTASGNFGRAVCAA